MANYGQVTNKVYGELTNYDIYMMKKQRKQAQSRLFDRAEIQPNISYEGYRKKLETPVRKPIESPKMELSYREYLLKQLNREKPSTLLTEEEFYERKFNEDDVFSDSLDVKKQVENHKKPNNKAKSIIKNTKLKKGAKIFIAFYVLIVMIIASILIVVNTATPVNSERVDAGYQEVERDTVQPMSFEESQDGEYTNWFDELCKSLKK